MLRKVRLDIGLNEEFVEPTITTTNKGAQTDGGAVGNGKIFVLDLLDCVRISSGVRGGKSMGKWNLLDFMATV